MTSDAPTTDHPPARDPLDEFVPAKISRLFGEAFVAAHDGMETYTRATVRDLLPAVFEGKLPAEFGMGELLATGVADQAKPLAEWMVGFLVSFDDLERTGERFRVNFVSPLAPRAELKERAIAAEASVAAAYSIVDRCAEGAIDFIRGRAPGESIVFALSALNLWFDYFDNKNFLYAVNNRLAALAFADELAAQGAGGELRNVAEFGGGAGSAALAFLDEAESRGGADALGGPFRYSFTEPMKAFGRRGERNLKSRIPQGWELVPGTADINEPLIGQGFEPASLSGAWAVNTFHVARDLGKSLGHVREILRPGGVIVLGECVRPFPGQILYPEFVFDFLANFRDVVTGPNRRTHGFLTPEEWVGSLEAAGFVDVKVIPDIARLREVYPKFFTAAIVAKVPAA